MKFKEGDAVTIVSFPTPGVSSPDLVGKGGIILGVDSPSYGEVLLCVDGVRMLYISQNRIRLATPDEERGYSLIHQLRFSDEGKYIQRILSARKSKEASRRGGRCSP